MGTPVEPTPIGLSDWTYTAARGECAWFCPDCLQHFENGMPDECCFKSDYCNGLIKRDKMRAMPGGEL